MGGSMQSMLTDGTHRQAGRGFGGGGGAGGAGLTLGSRNFLMFSADAEAKQYSVGCKASPLTLFLW